jgi:D-serine dehydratase
MMNVLANTSVREKLEKSGASLLDKGIPFGFQFDPAIAAQSRINILEEALHFPLLILKESALAYNLTAMAEWCAANKFLIAPHGKTTMTPRIFERQIQAGAWGMTVATASQAVICAEMGIRRILIANQVVGRANIRSLATMMKADPALELFCLVDSADGIEFLSSEWQAAGVGRPLGVLVEMGRPGWRTGARSLEAGLQLCAEIRKHPRTLRFRGIEGFEGSAHASDPAEEGRQVKEFLADVATLGEAVRQVQPAENEPLLLTVGGSSFLDAVWEVGRQMQGRFQIVIRSGCYVTHDHGFCAQKLDAARHRGEGRADLPTFRPALELWSHVQSKPEEGLAIVNFGKRDCAYDLGLPVPLFAQSFNSGERRVDLTNASVVNCNDQHAHLRGPGIEQLRVGDQVCCGISHPCTAFDKWRILPVVDDAYNVLDIYRTYF